MKRLAVLLLFAFGLLFFGCITQQELIGQQNFSLPNLSAPPNRTAPVSNEVDCNIILTSNRTVILSNMGVGFMWTSRPDLNAGFAYSVAPQPFCQGGKAVGQNVNHLYCQDELGRPQGRVGRTNLSKEGVIESQECYIINITELAPSNKPLPDELKPYGDMNSLWDIANVTCERC